MKSVLFFIESLDGGGAEGALENIITNLDKSRFKLSAVSETDKESRTARIAAHSKYHCFAHRNLSGSRVHEFFNRIIYKLSADLPPSVVRKVFIRGRYDIEVAGCEGYATKVIGNSKDKKSKKIAWVHTDFVNNPWSVEAYENAEEEKSCYEKFDAIICVSETIKDAFIKKYGFEDKVRLIHNIVDNRKIIEMGAEPLQETFDRPLFIMAGSFLPVKGYERAARIYGRLHNEGYRFSVIIMGIGYERYKVEAIINELQLQDTITLMDYQPNPYQYMANADAYVCSSYAEGYSTTVSESVILGTPVITTECSGMREIFGDKECGIICENSDESLYNAIKKVLDEPELLQKFRQQAQERSEYFDKNKLVKEVENLFENI